MVVFIVKSYGGMNKWLTILQHFFIVAGFVFLNKGVIKFIGWDIKWQIII